MKKTNLFISLACALVLVAVMAAPAMATDATKTATVSINEFISATISGAIDFGPLNQGDINQPALSENATAGAIIITVAAETNVNCLIGIVGSGDFTDGSHNFALDNATWNTTSYTPPGTPMSVAPYVQIGTFNTPGEEAVYNVWHWINIPAHTVAGDYHTDFSYKIDKTL